MTVEKGPSLQRDFGNNLYVSLQTEDFPLPLRSPLELVFVVMRSLGALRRLRPPKPLAVYAYNQDPENVITGLAFKLILGRPLAVVHHHITRLSFAPLGVGIAERRRKGYGLFSSVWLSLVPAINRRSALLADFHLALSVSTKKEAEEWIGVKDCVVVGNGVDIDKFTPMEVKKEYDAAFLGRIVPQKGIDTLLKAWSLVVERRPGSTLALIGGSDPSQIRLYESLAKEVGVDGSVVFKGFLSDADVVKALNSSRLFVFPSRKEGFAQAVSQAMACGLCCVISDIPALKETYEEAAVFVPPSDSSALAEQVVSMLSDRARLEECGANSRRFVERFDWGDVVEKELRVLNLSAR